MRKDELSENLSKKLKNYRKLMLRKFEVFNKAIFGQISEIMCLKFYNHFKIPFENLSYKMIAAL